MMRILTFIFLFTFLSCSNDAAKQEESQQNQVVEAKNNQFGSVTHDNIKYVKTATNSEFAYYRTISANETHTTYFFKTLDGISLNFDVSIEGEPERIVPRNLLEDAKYLEGHPGANAEMVGQVFELIYDKDNFVGEVKLAKVE